MQMFLRLPEVKKRVGLSKSFIYQQIAEGAFPAPIPLGARAVGWDSEEIDSWIAGRISSARNIDTRVAKKATP